VAPHARPGRQRAPSVAVDLANSVACPGCRGADPLASIGEAQKWIRIKFGTAGSRISRRDLEALREFRAGVRDLLASAVDGTAPHARSLRRVNEVLGRSTTRPRLTWSRGDWRVEARDPNLPTRTSVENSVAASAAELLAGPQPLSLRRCEGPGCVHFLLARTTQQRWCSPTGCGNRARVQRHYLKLRSRRGRTGTSRRSRARPVSPRPTRR
jgi:predicted RNA-binding Zn ribbon-like protein